jgi:ribosomal protein S18 acetylase RimI-like enzyme
VGDSIETIRLIEELAANAWPAPVQQQLEAWKLRAANGVTRRANSVLPLAEMPTYRLWLDEVAAFYQSRNLPVRFQVSDASPVELTTLLDSLNFTTEALTSVQIARCQSVLERCQPTQQHEISTAACLESAWLDAFMRIEGHEQSKRETYRQIMSAIGPSTLFVKAIYKGEAVGAGMAVMERGWAGLFNIATSIEQRRKGIARQVIAAMVEWASRNGAANLYLQVMKTNGPAISLYSNLGFSHLYSYHYRTSIG